MRRWCLPLLPVAVLWTGCDIDTSALWVPPTDGGGGLGCPPGRWEINGDPDDGCEYVCTPTSPTTEVCDGVDNDCDPGTPDGQDDPGVGGPCDGPDDDLCLEGVFVCVGGRIVCDDWTGNSHEVCNGLDDDCDGLVDEDATDEAEWFLDRDGDGYGSMEDVQRSCEQPEGYSAMGGDCDDLDPDVSPGTVETCNGIDDDCNGIIDDAPGGCDCMGETWMGEAYFFCRSARSWTSARDECAAHGRQLVTIESAEQNGWIAARCALLAPGAWWIGLNDRASEGSFRWIDGSSPGYTAWQSGEPNSGGGGWFPPDEDCVELNAFSTPGTWNDAVCSNSRPHVCH